MATMAQMWDSVRGTLDEFAKKLLKHEVDVKKQNNAIASQGAKVDGLEAQLGGMHARIAALESQMNAIAYQQASE